MAIEVDCKGQQFLHFFKEVIPMDLGYLLLMAIFFVVTGLLINGCESLRGKS